MTFLRTLIGAVLVAVLSAGASPAFAAGEAKTPLAPPGGWSFSGIFGQYDQASLQRGFQVYKQVCASCHSMELISYRNLGQPGALGYSEDEIKAIAAEYQVAAGPDPETGDIVDDIGLPRTRPALPSDRFFSPYINDIQARAANGGALPPDLSVMAKARAHGPEYIYSLLKGYVEPPETIEVPAGQYYNPYFPGGTETLIRDQYRDAEGNILPDVEVPYGGVLAMAPPLLDDIVIYADGTPATVAQMAKDVTYFLTWAAEPELNGRKRLGFIVLVYLTILTVLLYLAYRKVWRNVDH